MARKKSFTLEFAFRASPNILFGFLTTPSGLAQWFADMVDVEDGTYTFTWSGDEEHAVLIEKNEPELARFRWLEGPDNEFFEFKIIQSEVTGDTILFITDFAEEGELEEQQLLWSSQIANLQTRIGG